MKKFILSRGWQTPRQYASSFVLAAALGTLLAFGCKQKADSGINESQATTNAIFERGEALPADIITGTAWHKKLLEEDTVFTTAVGCEEFTAGSRNVWHSHPSGQIIIVIDGTGYHRSKAGLCRRSEKATL